VAEINEFSEISATLLFKFLETINSAESTREIHSNDQIRESLSLVQMHQLGQKLNTRSRDAYIVINGKRDAKLRSTKENLMIQLNHRLMRFLSYPAWKSPKTYFKSVPITDTKLESDPVPPNQPYHINQRFESDRKNQCRITQEKLRCLLQFLETH